MSLWHRFTVPPDTRFTCMNRSQCTSAVLQWMKNSWGTLAKILMQFHPINIYLWVNYCVCSWGGWGKRNNGGKEVATPNKFLFSRRVTKIVHQLRYTAPKISFSQLLFKRFYNRYFMWVKNYSAIILWAKSRLNWLSTQSSIRFFFHFTSFWLWSVCQTSQMDNSDPKYHSLNLN